MSIPESKPNASRAAPPPRAPDASTRDIKLPDPAQFARSMSDVAGRAQRLVNDWLKRQSKEGLALDPLNIGGAFLEMTGKLMANPAQLVQAQLGYWQDYLTLWQNTTRRIMGLETQPVIESDPRDKRFKDAAWKENEVFDFIKQSYLLSARYINDVVTKVDGLTPKTSQKIDFYSRQFVNALSPSNFLLTNPEVLRKTAESGGDNLVRGLNNLLTDLEQGRGRLRIKMTDTDAFKVGENIAVSEGKVIYQNALMQLIQYTPATETVYARPLVIFPPWINKFYILDLQPKNSLVRYAVSQGHTVFMVSWVNPDELLANKDFDDYMVEGVFGALDAIEKATGQRAVNAVGYCIGGTLLASSLAYMKRRGDDRIKSATFLVTLTDFTDAGELGVFIDEEQLSSLEGRMQRRGFLEGGEMASTFNMLRANDLIWNFVVNNYLLGNEPFPFDLLYWNSDTTRMPPCMHSFYLRNMYQNNLLAKPGGISMKGVPIDLGDIDIPVYFMSCREDHIAPWKSTYRGAQLFGGKVRFVLAASGHVAGVVNPPGGGKYNHFINDSLPEDPDAWFEEATEVAGSWWPDWQRWVTSFDKTQVAARIPGAGKLKAIEAAPGSYVTVRS
jgi:polyhydroxyalkanoate synthase